MKSTLVARHAAPKQGEEGSPASTLIFEPWVEDALSSIKAGDRLILLTWLHKADRSILLVHPRDDAGQPMTGVFSTRSQDRPNPIGLHRVFVLKVISPLEFEVSNLEAFDETPILDVKAMLANHIE